MKGYRVCVILVVAVLLLVAPAMVSSRRLSRSENGHYGSASSTKTTMKDRKSANPDFYRRPVFPGHGKPDTVQVAGSSLPDCSHACGSCLPCRLVMVSYVCSTIQEAETCPMAYKCMCNNKSYPVP